MYRTDSAYKELIEESIAGLFIYRDGQLEYVNPAFASIFGYTTKEMIGRPVVDFFHQEDQSFITEQLQKLINGEMQAVRYEVRGRKKDDRNIQVDIHQKAKVTFPFLLFGTLIEKIETKSLLEYPSNQEKTEQYLAYHDSLTDLPNRRLFSLRLNGALHEAKTDPRKIAVMFLDIDCFKVINDTLGHHTGDQLLQAIASRLVHCVRRDDTVARFGGDEFVVLLPKIYDRRDAQVVAQKIVDVFKQPFELNGRTLYITPSVGVSIYPIHGEGSDTLITRADTAMYYAKKQGKNNFQIYSEEFDTESLEQLVLGKELRSALCKDEMQLFYQPKVDAMSGNITGIETFVRWHHTEFGVIPPSKFLPIAEETGLIQPIGEWILRKACEQNKDWQKQGLLPLRIAVNLSPKQFKEEDLVPQIMRILKDTGLEPEWLEIEITEASILQHVREAGEKIRHLKENGIHVTIDDFGTGYSSLSYLTECPIDALKIDQSLLHDIDALGDRSIISAIISIAKSLQLDVIAEGVETEEQLSYLRNLGCKEAQGYLFSKPVEAEQFAKVLKLKEVE